MPALTTCCPSISMPAPTSPTTRTTDLVGTGPFSFAEHKPGEYYRLDRNPDYWDQGKPYLDESSSA